MPDKNYWVFESKEQTITNKIINADDNTISELEGDNFKSQATTEAGKVFRVKTDGTIGFESLDTTYLKLSGGTMTGSIISNATPIIKNMVDSSSTVIRGGTANSYCGRLELNGGSKSTDGGAFSLSAGTSSENDKSLVGKPDGTLTWNGKDILNKDTGVGMVSDLVTDQTRVGLMNSLNDGESKLWTKLRFTAAESPDGNQYNHWSVEVHRVSNNYCSIVAWGLQGEIYTSAVGGGSWSGWRNCSDGDGVWRELQTGIQYCKKNGIVFIEGSQFTIPLPTYGEIAVIGVLPEGYRPTHGESKGAIYVTYGKDHWGMCWVTTAGEIRCWNTSGTAFSDGPRMFVSFPAA